ncbi:MAG TPA: YggT family protein [Candidatus Dormibacteraeota bacterium]|jgi:YggT family protein
MGPVLGLLQVVLYLFVILIFVRVAFSWIGPNPRNRLFLISYQLTEPILGPVRRLLPQSMGIDLSPMIVTFLIFMLINVLRRGG